MNIIELLKERVTTKVLQGDLQFQDEKIGALSAFYPILLSVLKSKPEIGLKWQVSEINQNPMTISVTSFKVSTHSQIN